MRSERFIVYFYLSVVLLLGVVFFLTCVNGHAWQRVKVWLPPIGWEHSDHRIHEYEYIKLTTYAKKYIGHRTSSGTRFTGGMTAATNREYIFMHHLRIWKNGQCIDVLANDKFNRKKFALPFLKFDLSAKAMRALGLKGMAWADSIEVVE